MGPIVFENVTSGRRYKDYIELRTELPSTCGDQHSCSDLRYVEKQDKYLLPGYSNWKVGEGQGFRSKYDVSIACTFQSNGV